MKNITRIQKIGFHSGTTMIPGGRRMNDDDDIYTKNFPKFSKICCDENNKIVVV